MGDPIHVYPINDLVFHVLTEQCPCDPTVIVKGRSKIVIHRAWDEREKSEPGAEMSEMSRQYIN
jgi:hypothetical protein